MDERNVIDLVDSDDDDENDVKPPAKTKTQRPSSSTKRQPFSASSSRVTSLKTNRSSPTASIVLEEDQVTKDDVIVQEFRQAQQTDASLLFQDTEFRPLPSSIRGSNNDKKSPLNCRCKGSQRRPAKLGYKKGRPFYSCASTGGSRCNYFAWAYQAERLQWYRFGSHTGHVLVAPQGFAAQDLCQGRVGDCWFLSALAVVAERPDLIARLFHNQQSSCSKSMDNTATDGGSLVQVNLFLDGYWKTVVIDNFLPCMVDSKAEGMLQQAIQASLPGRNGSTPLAAPSRRSSSKNDPFALADECRDTLRDTQEFLEQHQRKTMRKVDLDNFATPLKRPVTSEDLAYSKAKNNQLWAPFLEKAYAKSHGCYSAISGGHIAEAFLDLTGAPTLVHSLHSPGFSPRSFWYKLLQYRRQRLPMGCGTDSSAAGIIGMHAYSILDVREVKNVPFSFFQDTGVAHGNVSGFTEYDGTVRLLRVRNPHGKGEWKGDFSDQSQIWEKLLQHGRNSGSSNDIELTRTMKNDGTFWIDYDNFLMGFSNVDVVLAFLGNHAKSFPSCFPSKKSNIRCAKAFEVSLLDEQPGLPCRDTVELYIMGIQKTRRGATSGRVDRKKSYKVCDLGMLVGEGGDDENERFSTVNGEMFGFRRDGHYRVILNRQTTRRMVVMPISFGHPAATDKELPFVLRFVSDAPLLIRELPDTPRMDLSLQQYCLGAPPSRKQGIRKILLQSSCYRLVQVDCRGNGGGVVFLYLCVHEAKLRQKGPASGLSFAVEANCRGMSCRTETGLLNHETVAKGKKFEAAWRRYSTEFIAERESRLLLALYQSGQDTEFGSIQCKSIATPQKLGDSSVQIKSTLEGFMNADLEDTVVGEDYEKRGVFNSISGNKAFDLSLRVGKEVSVVESPGLGFHTDGDLGRALAISRGDLEVQAALEASRLVPSGHGDAMNADMDLQRALELSKQDISGGNSVLIDDDVMGYARETQAGTSHGNSYDDDLAKAIQLSMQQNSSTATPIVVDLTEEESSSKRKREDVEEDITDKKPLDLSEKRRLAAEAAITRLKK